MEIWRNKALLYNHIGDLRRLNVLATFFQHIVFTKRPNDSAKPLVLSQPRIVLKFGNFFKKKFAHDGCRSIINNASEVR